MFELKMMSKKASMAKSATISILFVVMTFAQLTLAQEELASISFGCSGGGTFEHSYNIYDDYETDFLPFEGPQFIASVGEPLFEFKWPDDLGTTLQLESGPAFDAAVEKLSQPKSNFLLLADSAEIPSLGYSIKRFTTGVDSPSEIGRIDLLTEHKTLPQGDGLYTCVTVKVFSVPEPIFSLGWTAIGLLVLFRQNRAR